MATQNDYSAMLNQTVFDQLATPGMEKTAIDAVNMFTRTKMREEGFWRKLIQPLPISNDELDPQVDTDNPVKICEKEPDSPAAISIPFGTLPVNIYIQGPRYRVMFDRIVTPRFTKDIVQLRTWQMDIRQVLSDNAIKDMLAEEDSKFIAAVNTALVALDTVVPTSGVAQWQTVVGGITRSSLQDAFKIMPSTPFHLEAHTVLINNVSIREVMKWGRDEMGGDYAQDLVKSGWSEQTFMGVRWIITIKRDLVPDDTIYMFSHPKFIGKSFLLDDTTMYVKREAYMIEFFAYETCGGTLGHSGGLARADFT